MKRLTHSVRIMVDDETFKRLGRESVVKNISMAEVLRSSYCNSGYWEIGEGDLDKWLFCSSCHLAVTKNFIDDNTILLPKYCSHCGCRMERGDSK